jgi:hypothetical protein
LLLRIMRFSIRRRHTQVYAPPVLCRRLAQKNDARKGAQICFVHQRPKCRRAAARKQIMRLNFDGRLSSRCWVPGVPSSWGAGDLSWYGPCICRQYYVYGPCLSMGAQIKADVCWLLMSRCCFTPLFYNKPCFCVQLRAVQIMGV